MTEPQRISTLLTQIHQGPAWHGPSLREMLEGVDAKLASRRLMPEAHTIWKPVLHLTAWLDSFRVRVVKKGASMCQRAALYEVAAFERALANVLQDRNPDYVMVRQLISSAWMFDRIVKASPSLREISHRAQRVLLRIGSESPINVRRVRKYGVIVSDKPTWS